MQPGHLSFSAIPFQYLEISTRNSHLKTSVEVQNRYSASKPFINGKREELPTVTCSFINVGVPQDTFYPDEHLPQEGFIPSDEITEITKKAQPCSHEAP
jgi:hypothetical protein